AFLGQDRWVVARQRPPPRPDRHSLGDGCHRRQHGPRLPWTDTCPVDLVQQVLPHPARVETGRLDQSHHLGELRPANRTLHLGELDTDFHLPLTSGTRLRVYVSAIAPLRLSAA